MHIKRERREVSVAAVEGWYPLDKSRLKTLGSFATTGRWAGEENHTAGDRRRWRIRSGIGTEKVRIRGLLQHYYIAEFFGFLLAERRSTRARM